MPDQRSFDVAIIGGGPAGLSAALWLARYLHSVVLVDNGDPRNWETRGIHGFLGHRDITPPVLREQGRQDAREHGVLLIDDFVDAVARDADRDEFELTLHEGKPLHARRLLLAFGLRDIWPDIPGLQHVYGDTAHVCPDCDGYEARGCKTVVIGSGRKAVGMALALMTWTRELVICTNGEPANLDQALCDRVDAIGIPVLEARIQCAVSSDGQLRWLELEGGMHLDCDRLFFSIDQVPADDLGAQLGCARDEQGHLEIDASGNTSVKHVWAAGDITPGPQLAIVAAGEGATAAISIHKSLLPAECVMPAAGSGEGKGDGGLAFNPTGSPHR